MSMSRITPVLLAALFAASCADGPEPLEPALEAGATEHYETSSCDSPYAARDCEPEPGSTTFSGWPFFGPHDDSDRSAPNDPSPSAAGIWLGWNTTPETCFAHLGASIVDVDKDWMDDGCEYRIAHAFAPLLLFSEWNECAGGEPYWAAKYFVHSEVVRIAYMPAYYDDCGIYLPGAGVQTAHTGDAEFILVEVKYNRQTKHWELERVWLSAHHKSEWDRSEWVGFSGLQYSKRYRGHPTIWVARHKHANYKSRAACTAGLYEVADRCWSAVSVARVRFPVTPATNVGSRFAGIQCVGSRDRFQGNGRQECFYAPSASFRGWQTIHSGKAPSPYYDYLMSSSFEVRNGDWGPGPNPPTLTAGITGPTSVEAHTSATWTASVSHGAPPYTYRWEFDFVFAGTGSSLTRSVGAHGTVHHVHLRVTDAHGVVAIKTLGVSAVGSDGTIRPIY